MKDFEGLWSLVLGSKFLTWLVFLIWISTNFVAGLSPASGAANGSPGGAPSSTPGNAASARLPTSGGSFIICLFVVVSLVAFWGKGHQMRDYFPVFWLFHVLWDLMKYTVGVEPTLCLYIYVVWCIRMSIPLLLLLYEVILMWVWLVFCWLEASFSYGFYIVNQLPVQNYCRTWILQLSVVIFSTGSSYFFKVKLLFFFISDKLCCWWIKFMTTKTKKLSKSEPTLWSFI